ncbi:hypothetical protein WBG78_22700 [Chryseolinea sp. T2]|uniref:hypothetical protein n=1 Tax=Chryseolinea sp. T2 TaxID=3129255 RepID=UPI0030771487
MKSLTKYRYQFVLLVTLVVGYSQLFFPITNACAIEAPDSVDHYKSQSAIAGCTNPFYLEEGRTDEDDRFARKMVELPGYSLSFLYSVLEITARPSIQIAVYNTQLHSNELHFAARVLRL